MTHLSQCTMGQARCLSSPSGSNWARDPVASLRHRPKASRNQRPSGSPTSSCPPCQGSPGSGQSPQGRWGVTERSAGPRAAPPRPSCADPPVRPRGVTSRSCCPSPSACTNPHCHRRCRSCRCRRHRRAPGAGPRPGTRPRPSGSGRCCRGTRRGHQSARPRPRLRQPLTPRCRPCPVAALRAGAAAACGRHAQLQPLQVRERQRLRQRSSSCSRMPAPMDYSGQPSRRHNLFAHGGQNSSQASPHVKSQQMQAPPGAPWPNP
mmetsp:Transcript_88432/g.250657  ORF Transcript_88432/g.250657 Transcript_88432/m.250657 type:complete len:263 (+) Transcript_88432:219-1007(+)